MKCAICNCTPDECQTSVSPYQCPNCTQTECCCWSSLNPRRQR